MSTRLIITTGTHGFLVKVVDSRARPILLKFSENLAEFDKVYDNKLKRSVTVVKGVYATSNSTFTEFGFMLADLSPFMAFLDDHGVDRTSIKLVNDSSPSYAKVDINLQEGVKPRDEEQEKVMAFLKEDDCKQRVLELRTGGGKTACGYMATAHYKRRTAFVMANTHIGTWYKSDWVTDVNFKTETVLLQGSESLEKAVAMVKAGEWNYKYVFITIGTLRDFLKANLNEGYTIDGVTPWGLFEYLGIGLKIVDECHENIKALIHSTIHSNVSKIIYLSATLKTDNKKQQEQYLKIFPDKDKFKDGRSNDHIIAVSSHYGIGEVHKIKSQGARGYSHIKFEQSILKSPKVRRNYLELIWAELKEFYLDIKKDGQKAMVFVALKDFADILAREFAPRLKEYGLTTDSYHGDKAEKVLYTNDVVFTTPGSAGTGKDIENLSVAISTVAISSIQRNLQMLGRPRPLKNYPGEYPFYVWFTCDQIRKHRDYDRKKKDDYRTAVKEIRTRRTGRVL